MGDAHSQFAADGHAKTFDAKMEFLWTCHNDEDYIDVLGEFLQPVQQPNTLFKTYFIFIGQQL